MDRLELDLPVELGRGWFRWRGTKYSRSDQWLFLVAPNPFNADRVLYLFAANSALQLHEMTKTYRRDLPSWAVFEGDEVVDEGFHRRPDFLFHEFF